MDMQTFYSNIASQSSANENLHALAEISKASLEQVQAVRSELAWDTWKN